MVAQLKRFFKIIKESKLKPFFFIGITVLVMTYLLINERQTLSTYLTQIRYDFFFYGVILHLLAMCVQILGWNSAVTAITHQSNIFQNARVYSVSLVSRRIPFGQIWSTSTKFALYENTLSVKNISIATVLEHVLIGCSGITLLVFLLIYKPIPLNFNSPSHYIFLLIAIVFVILILVFFFYKRLIQSIKKWVKENMQFSMRDVWSGYLLFLLTWILDSFSFYFWVRSIVEVDFSAIDLVVICTLSSLASFFGQFLPLNTALKEITMVTMLTQLLPLPVSIVVSLVNRVAQTVIEIILAIFFYFFLVKGDKPAVIQKKY